MCLSCALLFMRKTNPRKMWLSQFRCISKWHKGMTLSPQAPTHLHNQSVLACLFICLCSKGETSQQERSSERKKEQNLDEAKGKAPKMIKILAKTEQRQKHKHHKGTNIAMLAGFSYYDTLQPKDNTSKHSWSAPWRNARIGHMLKTYTNICSRSIRFQSLQAGVPCWRSCNDNEGMRNSRPPSQSSSIHSSHIHPDHILCVHAIKSPNTKSLYTVQTNNNASSGYN